MYKIENEFCGYLKIDDDTMAYFVSNHKITLLPAADDINKISSINHRIRSRDMHGSKFLYGITGENYKTAFMRKKTFDNIAFYPNQPITFWSPIIIKANDYNNLITNLEWNKYHSIFFYGGNINTLYPPRFALKDQSYEKYFKDDFDGSDQIELKSWNERTLDTEIYLSKSEVKLSISIIRNADVNKNETNKTYSLGKLDSSIQLTFSSCHNFDDILFYYRIIKSLVALLTFQNNVNFETCLSQLTYDDVLTQTCKCKFYDGYENYSTRKEHQVIPIALIFDYIPNIIHEIEAKTVDLLLDLLPDNNKKSSLVSITDVQNLCTALEVAYGWSLTSKNKNPIIEELKKCIKNAIKDFTKNNLHINVSQETTISSAFKNLDYSAKEKIYVLYNENKNIVDEVVVKHKLPKITKITINKFVDLRNSRTHTGNFNWGDNAHVFVALHALLYVSFFKKVGMDDKIIKEAILRLF